MKCDLTLLSALSDGDLAEKQASRVREHLVACEACRWELSAIEAMRAQLSSLAAPEGEDGWRCRRSWPRSGRARASRGGAGSWRRRS